MIDKRILKYIPKSKQSAIKECFHDEDGYWIFLNEGWNADRMDSECRVIGEDTIQQLRYQIGGIKRVN